jgi:hypothetical protein
MAGAVAIGNDGVFSLEEHVPLRVSQQCAEGMIAVFARTAGHVDGTA